MILGGGGGAVFATHSQRNLMGECGSAPSQSVFWAALRLPIIGLALQGAVCQGLMAKSSSGVNDWGARLPKELMPHSPVLFVSEKPDRFIPTCLIPVTFSSNDLVLRRGRNGYHFCCLSNNESRYVEEFLPESFPEGHSGSDQRNEGKLTGHTVGMIISDVRSSGGVGESRS